MKFGFFGKNQVAFSITTPGRRQDGAFTRDFGVWANRYAQTDSYFNVEYDSNNAGTSPDLKLDNGVGIVFDTISKRRVTFGSNNIIGDPTDDDKKRFTLFTSSNLPSGFRYNSNATLSPTTRTINVRFSEPNRVRAFGWGWIAGFGGDYYINGSFKIPYFLNVDSLVFMIGIGVNDYTQITSFTGAWPPRIKAILATYNTSQLNFTIPNNNFPSSLEALHLNIGGISNINTLIQDATNLKCLIFGGISNNMESTILQAPATLDLSNMKTMEVVMIGGNTLSSFNYDFTTNDTLLRFHLVSNTSGISNVNFLNLFDLLLTRSNIKIINLRDCARTITKSFTNTDLTQTSLKELQLYGNFITGSINLTSTRTNFKVFKIGNRTVKLTDVNKNNISQINITGLTDATEIDLSNCELSDLQLPTNTVCTVLGLGGNKLDTTFLPNLVSQINAMTALTTLALTSGVVPSNFQTASTPDEGQDSTNGFGSNLDFSPLTNLVLLYASDCKLSGTLTINRSIISQLYLPNNNLTSIGGGTGNFTALSRLSISRNVNMDFDFSKIISAIFLVGHFDSGAPNTVITSIDLSNRTSTSTWQSIQFSYCSALTSVTLPTAANRMVIESLAGNIHIGFTNCTSLTSITNLENINYTSLLSPTVPRIFSVNDCALNTDLKVGINNFLPTFISLQNNGMNQTNVDLNINNIYQNRTKWNTTLSSKVMNIAGTNSTPSGTYQPPAGFGGIGFDGTAGSAKEQIYVLVNNYNWSITYT